jgi:hypothetical protein
VTLVAQPATPASFQRGQQGFDRRVVAESLADVCVTIHIAGPEDEAAAQLKWILPQLMLPESPALGALACPRVVRAQQVKKICGLQARRMIRLPFFVDQQRERDSGFLTEQRGVARITQPDSGQLGALASELCFVFAQLRDVLAAKNSAVVAQENDHGRVGLPQ